MPNFFTPEHQAFRKSVRGWVEKELAPHAVEWDRAGIFPKEVFKQAGELGFLGINHDVNYGGSGLDYWYVTAFIEELCQARNGGVVMSIFVHTDITTPVIHELGTVRMGNDPGKSAVNRYCQAHEARNVFVTDGGPFVSQADKNPTWTILALSMRTSEYIAEQMKANAL